MKIRRRYRVIVQQWTAEAGWRDYKVIEPRLPYCPIHFGVGRWTVGIFRIWLGFSKRKYDTCWIMNLGIVEIIKEV